MTPALRDTFNASDVMCGIQLSFLYFFKTPKNVLKRSRDLLICYILGGGATPKNNNQTLEFGRWGFLGFSGFFGVFEVFWGLFWENF